MKDKILNNKKCDIIVPIYNSPEWVKLCIYSLIKNTPKECINKIILMNDNSDSLTCNCIKNLEEKYKKEYNIIVSKNEKNLGFIKNVNKGFDLSDAEYVLLLNTDCLVSKNTIPKLIEHMEKNKKIGLICPISSNAANLSLDIFKNYSYMQMNELLEENFKGINFDACTVVGNCLMITRDCIEKVGYLDEIYGMGYGDETDYQFKAHEKGFEAKVAIDTYVFHKSEVSFGTSPEKQARLEHNRKIFFDRWGKEYNEKMSVYVKNDPIKYINDNLKIKEKPNPDVLFFLPDIHQRAGGVHIVVDIVNYLNINGVFANILTERLHDNYEEIMLFSPSYMNEINTINPKCIVGTIYPTIFFCETIAKHFNIPCVNFMQGYEPCFENGRIFEWAELACKSSQNILAISKFLKDKCKNNFGKEATVINNGINTDLLYNNNYNVKNKVKTITMFLRGNYAKGDFILIEILKQLTVICRDIEINVIYNDEIMKPINNNDSVKINYIKGPISRKKVNKILFDTNILVDASLMEGFGLTALESMAAGCVPVLSQSFGIEEYAENGKNSYIISEVNDADKYVKKIKFLIDNPKEYLDFQKNALNTARLFDIDSIVNKYINYFANVKINEYNLTGIEKEEIKKWEVPEKNIFDKKIATKYKYTFRHTLWINFLKIFPKKFKSKIKMRIRDIVNR